MTTLLSEDKKVSEITVLELREIIKEVFYEHIIDPDYGLPLKPEIKEELKESLKQKNSTYGMTIGEAKEKLGIT